MNTKPCKFCDGYAIHAPVDEMKKHGAEVFFCHDCQAEYIYFIKKDICASTSLYTKINNRMFRWTVTSAGIGTLSRIINPGVPGIKKNGKVEFLKSFNPKLGQKFNSITPKNIYEKIKTWILFL
jgi:hypothetical protein